MTWMEARHEGRLAREAKDYPRYRAALQALYDQSGSVHLLHDLAAIDVLLGDRSRAVAELGQIASEGMGLDLDADADLAPLKSDPAWPSLVQRMRANRAPVASARPFAALPKEGLVAEDVAYDADRATFFVSSVRRRKILALDAKTGVARDFVAPGDHGIAGVLGLSLQGTTLWATTADFPLVDGYDPSAKRPTELLAYDARTGALLRRLGLPADGDEHALTDLTATPDAVYVSDAVGAAVYVLARGKEALVRLTAPGALASPQTPTLSADGKALFIPDYARGIAVLRLDTGDLHWLGRAEGVALGDIDGLYRTADGFLAVQNGMEPPRVAHFLAAPDGRRIARADVLERATPGLGEPTHGVVVDGAFYFIVSSGWSRFDDDGKPQKNAPPDEPAIWMIGATK
jgi:hypothetical protein